MLGRWQTANADGAGLHLQPETEAEKTRRKASTVHSIDVILKIRALGLLCFQVGVLKNTEDPLKEREIKHLNKQFLPSSIIRLLNKAEKVN